MILRVTSLTLAIVPFYIDCAWYIWRNPAFRYPIVRPLLVTAFGAIALWNVVRLGLMVVLEPGVNQIWTPSVIQGVTMIFVTAVNSSVTTGFIVLNFQRASTSLQQQERRLSLAFSATQDAIWEWNVQTNETYYSQRRLPADSASSPSRCLLQNNRFRQFGPV
jgi:PAS domain-containing protein